MYIIIPWYPIEFLHWVVTYLLFHGEHNPGPTFLISTITLLHLQPLHCSHHYMYFSLNMCTAPLHYSHHLLQPLGPCSNICPIIQTCTSQLTRFRRVTHDFSLTLTPSRSHRRFTWFAPPGQACQCCTTRAHAQWVKVVNFADGIIRIAQWAYLMIFMAKIKQKW